MTVPVQNPKSFNKLKRKKSYSRWNFDERRSLSRSPIVTWQCNGTFWLCKELEISDPPRKRENSDLFSLLMLLHAVQNCLPSPKDDRVRHWNSTYYLHHVQVTKLSRLKAFTQKCFHYPVDSSWMFYNYNSLAKLPHPLPNGSGHFVLNNLKYSY